MKLIGWIVFAIALLVAWMAGLAYGWPTNISEAGDFATFIAAIMTPVSLVLVVMTLEKQESSQKQATRDGFLAVQVQALIALIEDDRSKLDGMTEKLRHTGNKSKKFIPVQQRYQQRVAKLNELLAHNLDLPDLAEK